MLVFVVPLKSSEVSKSWELVTQLFERCVRSICNQTSQEYRVIVVCHERPRLEFRHPKITYIEVDFPPANEPDPFCAGHTDRGYGYYKFYVDHEKIRGMLAQKGTPLKPLPFPGAIYIVATGENLYYETTKLTFNILNRKLLN